MCGSCAQFCETPARDEFLSEDGTIGSAARKIAPGEKVRTAGLPGDIEALVESIKRYPWTSLSSMKGDQEMLTRIDEAQKLLKELRKVLAKG